MGLWVIEPVADSDDPRWQDRLQFQRVIVRAETAAFARFLARTLDTPEVPLQFGQQNAHLGSGFKDEKLYRVRPYHGDAHDPEGPDGVLEAVSAALPGAPAAG
jgi:hypothetical protein